MPKRGYFTLRLGLGTAFVGIVILTSLLLGLITFMSVRTFIRNGIRERLADAVSIAALQIDPAAHRKLKTEKDENSGGYRRIKKTLQNIRERTKDIKFVYTIRKDKKSQIRFVVDAEENPDDMSHIGDAYDDPTGPMLAAFEKPYRVQVENQFYTDQWGTFLSSYAPVLDKKGKLEAVLGMDISAEKIIAYERRFLVIILIVSAAVALFSVALGILLSRGISKPLVRLESEMSRVQKFDLDGQIDIRSSLTEVVKMKTAVENMKNGLRSFKKYVPSDLVAELIKLQKEATLGMEKRELTVFFSDVAGFTSLSEKLTPDQLAENMGIYFKGMTATVLRNLGTVDKFIGDAIMAFWGAPYPQSDHALLACRTALECQAFLDSVSVEWARKGIPSFATRIGLNTGDALVGNMGYEERLSYTAMGDNVNLASRLEGLNKYYGTRIIISESTLGRVRDRMETRQIDTVAVKGKKKGVAIFELVAEKGALDPKSAEFINRYNEAYRCYAERRWDDSVTLFREAGALKPEDHPTKLILERCLSFQKNPPPADWDGVTVMQEK